jgi:23S rRNA (adenine2503-C2)-methyltransferase
MADAGVPEKQRKMRVNQIWHWLYVRGASDFADMHTISKELRETLDARFSVARPGNRRRTDFKLTAPASG